MCRDIMDIAEHLSSSQFGDRTLSVTALRDIVWRLAWNSLVTYKRHPKTSLFHSYTSYGDGRETSETKDGIVNERAMLPRFYYTVSQQKVHPFYFCDNFSNCKPIEIIFGRNMAEKICNRLRHGNFDICLWCVAHLDRNMTPIYISSVSILVEGCVSW